MKECAYRKCDIEFERPKRGKPKRFCCYKHNKAEYYLKKLDEAKRKPKQPKKKITKEQKEKARIFASLHCVNYQKCLCSITMPCFNCGGADIKQNSWMREPGALHHNQDDYHSVCLPSNGRSE